ncbi:PAN domain protein [Cooperia oncophora]
MMTNVAGGLEHDVSMDECKCFCANSKTSRRYSFECLSATYYHEERDCILNLDDRHRNPQLLEKQSSDYAVTYLAMTCGKGIVGFSVSIEVDGVIGDRFLVLTAFFSGKKLPIVRGPEKRIISRFFPSIHIIIAERYA